MDLTKERIATEIAGVRDRSLGLLDPLPDDEQLKQHSPLMSPLVWDLAHVGNYEEIWLLRAIGAPAIGTQYDDVYDAFMHTRDERPQLPLLGPKDSRIYVADIRGRVLDTLETVEFDPSVPLLREAYVYGMVVQHEHQHDETMLATLQLMQGEGYSRWAAVSEAPRLPSAPVAPPEVFVAGGPFAMGTDDESWAYDNERKSHTLSVEGFWIDTAPVSNGEYERFIEAGGYQDPRFWSKQGWAWRKKSAVEHPQFWQPDGGGSWSVRRFGRIQPLRPYEPVQHVCWFEAEAFARWAGKRLPTEAEWEKAASWDPATGTKRRYPWGNGDPTPDLANLGQRFLSPSAIGAFPGGASAYGCHQMIGDVWEWTSSDFRQYPGYRSFPYREYSDVFFGSRFKVLRGGSWATHPTAARTTFRNWDFPIRRQIFSGFRCARDA